jgi:arsenite methyltransferase
MGAGEIRLSLVRRYSALAETRLAGENFSCGPCAATGCCDPVTAGQYEKFTGVLPSDILSGALGCGDTISVANLQQGDVVLDLGCGTGVDVLLAGLQVGPSGHVCGLDFTQTMLRLAQGHCARIGLENVSLVHGDMTQLPFSEDHFDVVLANGVLTLTFAKFDVINEVFRVLRPGGRFIVADTMLGGPAQDTMRSTLERWAGCVGGSLDAGFLSQLNDVGFESLCQSVSYMLDVKKAYASVEVNGERLDCEMVNTVIQARKPRKV